MSGLKRHLSDIRYTTNSEHMHAYEMARFITESLGAPTNGKGSSKPILPNRKPRSRKVLVTCPRPHLGPAGGTRT